MNDNWAPGGWRSNLLGGGFKVLGLVFLIGAIVLSICGPNNQFLHVLWSLMGIAGFAMVMV